MSQCRELSWSSTFPAFGLPGLLHVISSRSARGSSSEYVWCLLLWGGKSRCHSYPAPAGPSVLASLTCGLHRSIPARRNANGSDRTPAPIAELHNVKTDDMEVAPFSSSSPMLIPFRVCVNLTGLLCLISGSASPSEIWELGGLVAITASRCAVVSSICSQERLHNLDMIAM
jgi:hypothetical protein